MSKCPLCGKEVGNKILFSSRAFYHMGKEYRQPAANIKILKKLVSSRGHLVNTPPGMTDTHFNQVIHTLRLTFLEQKLPFVIMTVRGSGYELREKSVANGNTRNGQSARRSLHSG